MEAAMDGEAASWPHLREVEEEMLPVFVREMPNLGLPAAFVRATVRLIGLVCADRDTMRVRLATLEPRVLVAELQRPCDPIEPFVRDFLAVAASFYGWLGARGHLSVERAAQIAAGLARLARE
jgi:hypothetical protein